MTRYSTTRSRCACGHRIVMVDGRWQHAEPHPDHACGCSDPKPSENIAVIGERGGLRVRASSCSMRVDCLRRESEMGL